MNQKKSPQNNLTIPDGIGRTIVEESTLIACPLLGTDRFIKFCKDRSLTLDRQRLIRLERLRLFEPIFRVKKPSKEHKNFLIPPAADNDWFEKKWAWDTTALRGNYKVPNSEDRNHEGYYSIFQIGHLEHILKWMTLSVPMDEYLELVQTSEIDWNNMGKDWLKFSKKSAIVFRESEFRRSRALLCQFVSNRYYPYTQGDQRTIRESNGIFTDQWITVSNTNWNLKEYVRSWDPQKTEKLFQLTSEKLRHAYKGLAIAQESCDPMANWYQLTQFVSVSERRNLKGDALRAETLRAGAHMLRLLYKDLYGEDLPHPNEVSGKIITHIPELEIRQDTRRYLEFVANRFGVNPQPKLCLMVEGPSEKLAVVKIFEKWFEMHPDKLGIEIVSLGGVDTATGGRKDGFRAILRLVDYLHHHQTFTFLILDNENHAKQLEAKAKKAKSIHPSRRYVTRPEHIKIWHKSFEIDNFSETEIAASLSAVAPEKECFTSSEVATCIQDEKSPMASLSNLYKERTGRDIPKPMLAGQLVDRMLAREVRSKIENCPIVKTLNKVANLAANNPFPTTLDLWKKNQASPYLAQGGS